MRDAFSMIELIISIVVMGIVVMAFPLILTQVQTNDAFTLRQEAILAAKTRIADILSYDWDENSYDPTSNTAYVLDTSSDSELGRVALTQRRVGHVPIDGRRKYFPNATSPSSTLGSEGGDLDDVDDFSTTTPSTISISAESAGTLDYVFDLNLTTTVTYASDSADYSASTLTPFALNPASNATSNIKTIQVRVSASDGTDITLRAFTCNIGESKPLASRPYL